MGYFSFIPKFIFSLPSICLILLSPPSLSLQTPIISTKPSVYEVLEEYNFPIGLLPKGVLDYDFDPSTGKFSAFLSGSCGFSLEGSYQLNYKSTIKGYISKGRLSNLEGVSVKLFWFWVDIVDVRRSGNTIELSVGMGGADFPIDNFLECPECGCGLNCNDDPVRMLRKDPFVYSQ